MESRLDSGRCHAAPHLDSYDAARQREYWREAANHFDVHHWISRSSGSF